MDSLRGLATVAVVVGATLVGELFGWSSSTTAYFSLGVLFVFLMLLAASFDYRREPARRSDAPPRDLG